MIKKVLVAVDGSENSWKALDFALDFTEKYGAKLQVLNVSESTPLGAIPQEPSGYVVDDTAAIIKDFRIIHEKILSRAITHAKETNPTAEVSSKLREGDAAAEIIAEARDGGFDIVVVGHAGAGRMKELLGLGGISQKVAHSAPCPVIIVR